MIDGEVKYAGKYALNLHRERLSHAVARVGGLAASGYARGARLARDSIMLRLNIEEALDDEEGPNDIVLKPGDAVLVPRKPGTVSVRGEVQNPGIYGYVEKESFSDYLKRAGGVTDSSDFAVITFPEGDSKQVGLGWFASDPTSLTDLISFLQKCHRKNRNRQNKKARRLSLRYLRIQQPYLRQR